MAWFVFIVECVDKSFYTGITWNLKQRVTDHNSGKYKSYTKPRRPVKLVCWERFKTRFDAAHKKKLLKDIASLKNQI